MSGNLEELGTELAELRSNCTKLETEGHKQLIDSGTLILDSMKVDIQEIDIYLDVLKNLFTVLLTSFIALLAIPNLQHKEPIVVLSGIFIVLTVIIFFWLMCIRRGRQRNLKSHYEAMVGHYFNNFDQLLKTSKTSREKMTGVPTG